VRYYEFTPDSSRVVYLADTDGSLSSGRIDKVYSQPAAGGAALELFSNPALDSIQQFTLTPAGDRAVFMPNWNQLWQASVNGAEPAGMLKDFGSDDVLEYKYSPDGKYLIAAIGVDLDSSAETLWAIPLNGAQQPFLLNHTLSGNGDIYDFEVSPDSAWVVYNAADATTAGSELYAVPLPEPGAMLLVGCAAAGLMLRRRRQGDLRW
jgi:hypothetical protein